MGLTKEVLSAHTQQEEQAFLDRFKDLSKLRVFDQTASSALRWQPPAANPLSRGECRHSRTLQTRRQRRVLNDRWLIRRGPLFPGLPGGGERRQAETRAWR